MKKTLKKTINVTARDIKLGERGECRRCPIARAMKRILPRKYQSISAGEFTLRGYNTLRRYLMACTPTRAVHFIRMFDAGYEVKPLKFSVIFKHINNEKNQ